MRTGLLIAVVAVVALAGSDAAPRVLAAAPIACDELGRNTGNGIVLSAESVQAGAFAPLSTAEKGSDTPYASP